MTIESNDIVSSNSIYDFNAKKINKMPISTAIEFLEKIKTIVVIKICLILKIKQNILNILYI